MSDSIHVDWVHIMPGGTFDLTHCLRPCHVRHARLEKDSCVLDPKRMAQWDDFVLRECTIVQVLIDFGFDLFSITALPPRSA